MRSGEEHSIFKDIPGTECALQDWRGQRGTDYEAPLSVLINKSELDPIGN